MNEHNTGDLCNTRSRRRSVKWTVGSLCFAFVCVPTGLIRLLDLPFDWTNLILFLVGVIALFLMIINLLGILNPEKTKLGKSLRPYFDGSIHTDVQAIFALIDKDIAENGKKFGHVWIGKDWILGDEAMRLDRIRGIFYIKMWKGKQNEYSLFLVDDQQNDVSLELTFEKQLDAVYNYLTYHIPKARRGTFKDYTKFFAMSDAEMAALNDEFIGNPTGIPYTFTGADNIPTSHVSAELIRETLNHLQPGERFILMPCVPLKSDWGTNLRISCHRLEGDGTFALITYFVQPDKKEMVYSLRFIPTVKARSILLDYFEQQEVPDITDWEDQSHLLQEESPMENYVLYVDGHLYQYISYDDVTAAWDELNEGKCEAILLRTPSWLNGYLEVRGVQNNYTVEVAGYDSNREIRGYRTHTVFGGHVVHWLFKYYHEYKYPEIRDDWEDISEEVRNRK